MSEIVTDSGAERATCAACGGTGGIQAPSTAGHTGVWMRCAFCNGRGKSEPARTEEMS